MRSRMQQLLGFPATSGPSSSPATAPTDPTARSTIPAHAPGASAGSSTVAPAATAAWGPPARGAQAPGTTGRSWRRRLLEPLSSWFTSSVSFLHSLHA